MRKNCILCLVLLCALISAFAADTCAYGIGETTVEVVPPPVEVRENQDFTVVIRILDVTGLSSYSFMITWDTSYLDFVSHTITPPFQPPWIIPSPIIDETTGFIIIGAATVTPPYYSGSASLANVTFHALKSGTTVIEISDISILSDPTLIVPQNAVVDILDSTTLVYIGGEVTSYGLEMASGLLTIFAAELSLVNISRGWSVFTVPPLNPRFMIFPTPAFNFTLYAFRIVNVSSIEFSYDSFDFWMKGFWEVGSVTNPRSVSDILRIVTHTEVTPGEFSVYDSWAHFEINTTGFDMVKGNIVSHCVRVVADISGKLPYGDKNEDGQIDMRDIGPCCKAFGSTLGFDRYDLATDLNCDACVDMRDIGPLARHFNESIT